MHCNDKFENGKISQRRACSRIRQQSQQFRTLCLLRGPTHREASPTLTSMPRSEDRQSFATNECGLERQWTQCEHTCSQPTERRNKHIEITHRNGIIAWELCYVESTYITEELKSSIFTAKHSASYRPRMPFNSKRKGGSVRTLNREKKDVSKKVERTRKRCDHDLRA